MSEETAFFLPSSCPPDEKPLPKGLVRRRKSPACLGLEGGLLEIRAYARSIGVDLKVRPEAIDPSEREGYETRFEILLLGIERTSGARGAGRLALEALIEFADRQGLPIRLHVLDGNPRLLDYYGELGFSRTGASYEIDPEMRREASGNRLLLIETAGSAEMHRQPIRLQSALSRFP